MTTRWITKTDCHDCFISVESSERDESWKWVSVDLMSTHHGWWSRGLRVRLLNAWRNLRGKGTWWHSFHEPAGLDAHIAALQAARTEAFGPPTDTTPAHTEGAMG